MLVYPVGNAKQAIAQSASDTPTHPHTAQAIYELGSRHESGWHGNTTHPSHTTHL